MRKERDEGSEDQTGRTRPAYPISSVDNALRLLAMFGEHERVRLSDAKDYLGVAHSTAHRLLAMLAFHGFVSQEPDSRGYVAGPALVEIGLAAIANMDVRGSARPLLEELTATFGETAHLVTLEGSMVRYLDAVESPRALRVASRTGTTFAAHCTASGKALLAQLSDQRLAALFPAGELPPAQTPESINGLADLRDELALVRSRGYAVNRGESEDGVASVAVAVPASHRAPRTAVSVSVPLSRLSDELIHAIAARIQQAVKRLGT
ncbi:MULTISPECIES: IclR family transcriptional regulator [Thermomonosporaceae]|uniref:IclR family transcriptional regulator n=1 Tax=Thermomonosporaceae TaxID=2012 RepID=UPI00255A80E2|nr:MULTISPECIES: IclR family transcriptional regulator [Thermomonosporaceae]MDL4773149.1 IclR family transcriptional regulator [Actinomadura xylanilytica]